MCTAYFDALRSAFPKRKVSKPPRKAECKNCGTWFLTSSAQRLCDDCRGPNKAHFRTYAELDADERAHFLRAARQVIKWDADPREWIVAQFATYRSASAFHGKFTVPAMASLAKEYAVVRWLEHKAREETRSARVVTRDDEDDDKKFFVEERELKGLARMRRVDPAVVLAEMPERFSKEFLKHKGVWKVVADLWQERRES